MAAGLFSFSFFTFHGTYGNQKEDNVNIFLIVKYFYWTFALRPQNHVSLRGVAAVGSKNYVIAKSTEHLESVAARKICIRF